MRLITKIIVAVVVVGVLAGGYYWYEKAHASQAVTFRTAEVKRGTVTEKIGATGTVEPEETVDVGAQVAGLIISFGKDTSGKQVDYGSEVDEKTILAQIDDSLYAMDVATAQAQLDLAKAGVVKAKADLGQMNAKLVAAQGDWERAQKLGASEALAQTTYDAYKATYETAKANVGVDEAAIVEAEATVSAAGATLSRAQRNLGYCVIKSPVKGVVIDRRVNIGQTVVSSLSAPSLFLLAKDLKRMQVWVAVNEADIGNIHAGQAVTFTADAFPGQTFEGSVGKVRYNANMTSNVVTYTVEVVTDNSSGKLLPYMTANVQFIVNQMKDVLMVPQTALTWAPQPSEVAAEYRTKEAIENLKTAKGEAIVWIEEGKYVKPIKVHTGLTDGATTEVKGEELSEGMKVVIGTEQKGSGGSAQTANPFMPQFRGGRGSGTNRPAGTGAGTGSGTGSGRPAGAN